MEEKCKIMCWQTFRKTLKETVSVQDSSKPWARTIVKPTMVRNGFMTYTENEIDGDNRKPRQILMEDFKDIIDKAKIVVYFVAVPTGHYGGYYKYLDIYYLLKK